MYNRLVNDFFRIAPHAEEYLTTEHLDPDRIQPSYNDGGFCLEPYDILRVELPLIAPYTHQVTNEASFIPKREIYIAYHSPLRIGD